MSKVFILIFYSIIFKPGKGCLTAVCWTEERPLPSVDPDVGLEVRELEVGLPARLLLASERPYPGVLISLLGPEKYDMWIFRQ